MMRACLRLSGRGLALLGAMGAAGIAQALPTARYAATVMDARTGEILYAKASHEARHPASITKVMTLFLTFDALEAGRLKLNERVPISWNAANQKPSRLGLRPGQSIGVDEAIRVIAIKSANDIAVALAEKVAGSEAEFVERMNLKARALGMRDTVFTNPSGLPDPENVTTAHDIALLSAAILRRHPDRYAYFSQREYRYGRYAFTNHNKLLGKVIGVDGIKTGYTLDAGYTLAASALRNGRRLIAVVLGEPTIASRNRDVTTLLETGFTVLESRSKGRPIDFADNLPPALHPAFAGGPELAQGSR